MASGYSRRMGGQDKLMLPIAKKPMIAHVLDQLIEAACFYEILLVARRRAVMAEGEKRGVTVIQNPAAHQGMSASIREGLQKAEGDCYMFLPGDQPFLKAKHLRMLCQKANQDQIICPRYKNTPSSPCIFPKKFREQLLSLRGEEGGKRIMQSCQSAVLYVDIEEEKALLDLDDPAQFQGAKPS